METEKENHYPLLKFLFSMLKSIVISELYRFVPGLHAGMDSMTHSSLFGFYPFDLEVLLSKGPGCMFKMMK